MSASTETLPGFSRVWRGAFTRGAATGITRASSFVATFVLLRRLSPAEAGSFFLALAAASTIGPVLNLGTAHSLGRSVSRLDAQGRGEESGIAVRSALRIVAMVVGLAALVVGPIAVVVGRSLTAWILITLGLAGLFALNSVGGAFLRARNRAVLAETLESVGPVSFLLLIAVVVPPENVSASGAFMLRSGVELVAAVTLLVLVLRAAPTSAGGGRSRSLLESSFPFWISGLAWLALQNADVLILGLVKGAEAVGTYVPVLRTADLAMVSQGLFAVYLLPVAASLFAAGRAAEIEGVYVRASACALALGAPIIAVLLLAPSAAIGVLLGRTPEGIDTVARILAIAYAFHAVVGLNGAVLFAIGDVRMLARRLALVLGITLLSDAVLIPAFGMTGAAAGTLVAFATMGTTCGLLLWRGHGIVPFRIGLMIPVAALGFIVGLLSAAGPWGAALGDVVVIGTIAGAAVATTAWAANSIDLRTRIRAHAGTRAAAR
jgi:O-antigen/teichoic acid export membrane protein